MIEEFTICLHCGCDRNIVNTQIEALKPLENEFNVYWNNRIDRREWYDSFSELINDSVNSSKTEFVILINDRTHPKPHEVKKIIQCLENGFAAATQYSVGFMGFSKQLLRTIGFWDERFYGGGWEDDDFVFRLRMADLAYYESCEAQYDYHWKTKLQPQDALHGSKSGLFFKQKWDAFSYNNAIIKLLPDETYDKYDLGAERLDIQNSWMSWEKSVIGLEFEMRPNQGPSRTHYFKNKNGQEYRSFYDYSYRSFKS